MNRLICICGIEIPPYEAALHVSTLQGQFTAKLSNDSRDTRNAQEKPRDHITQRAGERPRDQEFDERGRGDVTPGERHADDDGRMNDVDQEGAAREHGPDPAELRNSALEEGQEPQNETPGDERLPERIDERLKIEAAFGRPMKPRHPASDQYNNWKDGKGPPRNPQPASFAVLRNLFEPFLVGCGAAGGKQHAIGSKIAELQEADVH